MDWLGNLINQFNKLGLQEWQFGEFDLFLLVLTIRAENRSPFIFSDS